MPKEINLLELWFAGKQTSSCETVHKRCLHAAEMWCLLTVHSRRQLFFPNESLPESGKQLQHGKSSIPHAAKIQTIQTQVILQRNRPGRFDHLST